MHHFSAVCAMLFFWGCGPGPLPAGTELFVQAPTSDAVSGSGYILVLDADVNCSVFKDYIEDSRLFQEQAAAHSGVLIALSYYVAEGAESDAWLGTYGVNAVSAGSGSGDSGGRSYDTAGGGGRANYAEGVRSANVAWLLEDGTWLPSENSGLLITVDEYASDEVGVDFSHIWAEDTIHARNCGSW